MRLFLLVWLNFVGWSSVVGCCLFIMLSVGTGFKSSGFVVFIYCS